MAYVTAAELANAKNNRDHELAMDAHRRRMERRAAFVESNPNAVSPQERAAVQSWQHDQGLTGRESALQEHELNMLKERNAGELAVQAEKTHGMTLQGSEAARATGEANKAIAEIGAQRDRDVAEIGAGRDRDIAKGQTDLQRELAEINAETAQRQSDAQFGYFDKNGVYHGGSNVAAAEAAQRATENKAKIEGETMRSVAEINAEAQAAAREDKASERAEGAMRSLRAKIIANIQSGKIRGMSKQEWDGMTDEQKDAYIDDYISRLN